MPEPVRILLYALIAAASPVTLLATLVVLGSGRGRVNGLAFAIAFLLGQALAFIVVFFLGSVFTQDKHSTATAWIELAAGAALLLIALRGRPPHMPLEPGSAPRTEALFAHLARVTPGLAFGFGFPLGIGAKRLAITILAAATIALSSVSVAEELGLSMLYFVVGTTVVWVPVALYLVFGSRADDAVAGSRIWIAAHEQALAFYSALALGALFLLDGLVRLLT
jgi:Sap, sulfolipid-1-addressing protein